MKALTVAAMGLALVTSTYDVAKAGRFEAIVVFGVITQSPYAQRSTTVDTKGIFAPAGTDLAGSKIEILEQYEPEHFQSPGGDGNSAIIYAAKAPSPHLPGTILISVTINGVQRLYASGKYGNVITGSNYPNYVSQVTAADTSGNQSAVHLEFTSPVVFNAPFPTQSIVKTGVLHDFTFVTSDNTEEYLSFVVNAASH